MRVSVVGGGRMASAYAETLRANGISVFEGVSDLQPDILAAFFSGAQTLAFLETVRLAEQTIIVDLATQEVAEAQACAKQAAMRGAHYYAGGVTGGVRQVGSNNFTILLGGLKNGEDMPSWLRVLGTVWIFDNAKKAVAAKLLHNLTLILFNHALGAVMNLAEDNDIPDILDILERGTAGRAIRSTSVVRDRFARPVSSYSSELVAKDLKAIVASFPDIERLAWIDLRRLAAAHTEYRRDPYTKYANAPFGGHR